MKKKKNVSFKFTSYRVTEFPSFQVREGERKGGRKGGREEERTNVRPGNDHVISGQIRGLKKCTRWRKQTDRQTDMATL